MKAGSSGGRAGSGMQYFRQPRVTALGMSGDPSIFEQLAQENDDTVWIDEQVRIVGHHFV